MKAKTSSLWAQIVAALWIAGWTAWKFIVTPESITVTDIILSGFAVAAGFLPVYFGIIMDKIRDIKLGGKTE